MFISDFSVHHKITILMMTIMIIIFGVISYTRLGLDVFPEMDYPVISIITSYQGASPEEVESIVTSNLEMALAGVKNVKSISSESSENYSVIMVEFEWGSNLDASAQDIRDVIDMMIDSLPDTVDRPMVMKFDTSQIPIMVYGVTGMENSYHLQKVLKDDISNKLKRLPGVASINVFGGDEPEKQILVDKFKLEKFNISLDDISTAVLLQNRSVSGGHLDLNKKDYYVRTIAEYKSIEEIQNTPIKTNSDGSIIRIRDVAEVIESFKEKKYIVKTNNKTTAAMAITKESGANTLTVTNNVKNELTRLSKSGQYDLQFYEINNMGTFIEKTTNDASTNVIFGSILAILIMYFFIRNWRPTLAISVAIPISVIATFIPIYLMKYSLNLMTLGGLALGVGMLVDNAVVVIENIYRHIEEGMDRFSAAIQGTREVALAISASTFTTIAVFLPMVFSTGMTAILVRGLALTVAFSLLVSLIVALTIVPTFASVLFKRDINIHKPIPWFEYLRNKYVALLKICLAHRVKTLLIVFFLIIISAFLVTQVGAEFMPVADNPFIMMQIKLPKGTMLAETDALVSQIEHVFSETEGIESYLTMSGALDEGGAQADPTNPQNQAEAIIWAKLSDKKDRKLSHSEIMELLRSKIPDIKNGEIVFLTDPMSGNSKPPIEIKIFGNDIEQLQLLSNEITSLIKDAPDLRDLQNSLAEGSPELHFIINREKAIQYGLTPAQIANNIKTAIQGSIIGIFRSKGEEINIRLQYKEDQRISLEDFYEIRINSPMGISLPLNHLASLKYSEGQTKISRESQVRKATVTSNIFGKDLAGITKNVQKRIEPFLKSLPIGYTVEFGGTYKDMVEGFITLSLALLLSIVLVYIVMASQFESLKQPFVVMFTVPLSLIGVSLALFITGHTVSVPSFVGLIVLSGIVVNNGIVLIDYTNQLRNKGIEKHEALIKAGFDRMRPVFITALTTMIGMLPMAISKAEGAEMKNPMAVTIIGGLLSATFFTLVVIPVIYSLFDKISFKKVKN
ncbi:MAG: efflux RND transporter permease subunit [Endomicrobiaceae bacterium]